MKKEKIYAITSIVVFMAVLVLPSFLWLFISIVLPGYQEKFYNDRLPFRSVIISVNRKVDSLMEETYDAFVMPYLVKLPPNKEQVYSEKMPDIGDLIGLGNLSAAEYGGDINYSIDYKPSEYAVGVAGSDPGANFYSSVSPSGQPCNLVVVGDSFRIYSGLFMQKDFSGCTLIKYKNPGDLYNTDAANAIRTADCIVVLLVERNYMFMPGITSEMQSILKEK